MTFVPGPAIRQARRTVEYELPGLVSIDAAKSIYTNPGTDPDKEDKAPEAPKPDTDPDAEGKDPEKPEGALKYCTIQKYSCLCSGLGRSARVPKPLLRQFSQLGLPIVFPTIGTDKVISLLFFVFPFFYVSGSKDDK